MTTKISQTACCPEKYLAKVSGETLELVRQPRKCRWTQSWFASASAYSTAVQLQRWPLTLGCGPRPIWATVLVGYGTGRQSDGSALLWGQVEAGGSTLADGMQAASMPEPLTAMAAKVTFLPSPRVQPT